MGGLGSILGIVASWDAALSLFAIMFAMNIHAAITVAATVRAFTLSTRDHVAEKLCSRQLLTDHAPSAACQDARP